ncbi:MAG: ribosomal protein S18-alanine N-acetyltransferase [Geitlerinemataceae cyanobacterium]
MGIADRAKIDRFARSFPTQILNYSLLKIHPLTPDLLPAAVELDRLSLGGLWTYDGYARELESPNSDLLVLSRNNDTEAPTLLGVGCSWAIVDEAHITLLAIHPQYRRSGFGFALFWALLTSARQRGMKHATLEVRASNQAALSLYQRFGFQEAGRRRRYYPDDEDAVILWRGGLQHPDFPETLATWKKDIDDRLRSGGWELKTANNK